MQNTGICIERAQISGRKGRSKNRPKVIVRYMKEEQNLGTAAYQLGYISSCMTTEVNQR